MTMLERDFDDNPQTLTHAEVSAWIGRPITVQEANAFRLSIGCSFVDMMERERAVWG